MNIAAFRSRIPSDAYRELVAELAKLSSLERRQLVSRRWDDINLGQEFEAEGDIAAEGGKDAAALYRTRHAKMRRITGCLLASLAHRPDDLLDGAFALWCGSGELTEKDVRRIMFPDSGPNVLTYAETMRMLGGGATTQQAVDAGCPLRAVREVRQITRLSEWQGEQVRQLANDMVSLLGPGVETCDVQTGWRHLFGEDVAEPSEGQIEAALSEALQEVMV